ncbi:hypothetical protein K7432_006230 [Basidiobolus ranarum]|uniref:CCHC-type domain-containing protein n=1 Tax=Basidiobolus ranarum TaxID=34480 RepID=A0ABR2WVA0_9FUNG
MDSLHRTVGHTILNPEESNVSAMKPFPNKEISTENNPSTGTSSITTNASFDNQPNPSQPHSYMNSLLSTSSSSSNNISNLINTDEKSLTSEPAKAKPKRRTCYQCGEAGHTTMNCPQTEVNHTLPKRSSGKKLTPEEIQLVIHCYFKCEEERLTQKTAIKADSVRRTAFYLGMSKNTVARLVREYAQTGELPISKVRSESNKTQPVASEPSRKKLKWKEVDGLKSSKAAPSSSSAVGSNNSSALKSPLLHSPSPSPNSNSASATSTPVSSLGSVSNLPYTSSSTAVPAQSLMGIHGMLINSNPHYIESDAALSNIMNPVDDEDDTMLNFYTHIPDANPRN